MLWTFPEIIISKFDPRFNIGENFLQINLLIFELLYQAYLSLLCIPEQSAKLNNLKWWRRKVTMYEGIN